MEDLNEISLFPNPPEHYKWFTSESKIREIAKPKLSNIFKKLDTFMTFGDKYSIKELNHYTNNFENLDDKTKSEIEESKNIFSLLKNEIDNLQNKFKQMVSKLKNFDIKDINLKDMYTSFQKVYLVISILKKKQLLIQTRTYFEEEKNKNINLKELLYKNLEDCNNDLQKGLSEIFGNVSNGDMDYE